MITPYYEHNGIVIYHGDCLDVLPALESIDAVITDPPYGITACGWDSVIPLEPMWEHLKRITQPRSALVFTASQPFTTTLISSNMDMFKHSWVWQKNRGSNFANLSRAPFREHEDVVVFSRLPPDFNPVAQARSPSGRARAQYDFSRVGGGEAIEPQLSGDGRRTIDAGQRHPSSVQYFNMEVGLHPTQKPVALMAYMVNTYTKQGNTILDFAMGSGTTLVAAKSLGRRAIGVEIEEKYCEIAAGRLAQEYLPFEADDAGVSDVAQKEFLTG